MAADLARVRPRRRRASGTASRASAPAIRRCSPKPSAKGVEPEGCAQTDTPPTIPRRVRSEERTTTNRSSAATLVGEPPARRWLWDQGSRRRRHVPLWRWRPRQRPCSAQFACAASMGGVPRPRVPKSRVLAVLCETRRTARIVVRTPSSRPAAMRSGPPTPTCTLAAMANTLIRWGKDNAPALTPFGERLWAMIQRFAPDILILDTLADFYGGNEIDRVQVNHFVKAVLGSYIARRRAEGAPLSVILLGHPSVAGKSTGSGYSGSTAWNAAVRSRMYLTRPEEGASDERILARQGQLRQVGRRNGHPPVLRRRRPPCLTRRRDGDSLLWAAKEEVCKLVTGRATGRPYRARRGTRFIYTTLPAEMEKGGFSTQIVRQPAN